MNSPSLRFPLALGVLFALTVNASAQRGLPAQHGIVNFGKINESLYRGAQPDATGIQNLMRLGIKTIINLRATNDVWKGEIEMTRTNGLTYHQMPLRGLSRPTDDQVTSLLGLLEKCPGPVFIHCQFGCDRTGTIIACYRIQHDKWKNDAALAEAVKYGLSSFERGMRHYIANFGKKTELTISEKK